MDALSVKLFAVIGFITFALLMTRLLLAEIGKTIRYIRRWKARTFPPVDKSRFAG